MTILVAFEGHVSCGVHPALPRPSMLEDVPGAPVVVALLALVPAVLRWWWGRSLARYIDDPLLPERLAAHSRRVGIAAAFGGALVVAASPSSLLWAIPLLIVGQMAGGYPFRKLLYGETWGLRGYLWFFGRLIAVMFGFWILLGFTPSIAADAGRYDWIAALAMAAVLLAWNHWNADLLRTVLKTRPITDPLLVPRFEALVAKAGVPMPRFEYVAMNGGFLANAVALPSLRRSSVIFTDTLLEKISADETIAIAGHELAHLEYYDRPRLRGYYAVGCLLIAFAAALAPAWRLLLHSTDMGTPSMLLFGATFATLIARAKHRQKNETVSDLRAVELTGDAEALVRGLTTLHTIARIPRRWDQRRERQATHPSLARRIRDIRAAAGVAAASLEGPVTFSATEGVPSVTFDASQLAWREREGTTHLLDYGTLNELRLHAKSPGAPMRLVAGERHGRRWEMTPRPGDLPEIQALLDRVDGRLSHETSGHAMPAMSVRLAAVMAVVMGLAAGQLAFVLVTAIAAIVPSGALLNAAGTAAIVTAAIVLRDGSATTFSSGTAVSLLVLGVVILLMGRARRDETSRAANILILALGVSAAIGLVLVALDGLEAVRLHQSARALPGVTVLLAATAVAWFRSAQQRPRRLAAAAAALLGAALAIVGTTTFLDAAGRDPFLVASGPVRWIPIHDEASAQFDVTFEVEDVNLSPHGRLVALQPSEDDSQRDDPPSVLHVGLAGRPLTEMDATDIAFIDDYRAVVLAIHGGRAEVQALRVDDQPEIVWRQPLDSVRWGSIGFEPASQQWIVSGWDRDQRLVRASGSVGDARVVSTTWSGRTSRGGWVEAFSVRGTEAFVVERQYSFGPMGATSFRMLLPFVARAHNETQMWRLRGSERIDQGHSVLEASCRAGVLEEGRIACSAFDGTRTRFLAIDPATGGVTPLATMADRFVGTGAAAGGWLIGWNGSRATLVRPASREAIRAPVPDGEWVGKVTATGAVMGTVTSIDGGSRVRIYPLTGIVSPAGSTSASR